MRRSVRLTGFQVAVLAAIPLQFLTQAAGAAAQPDAAGVEFFERSIRPLLVEHCYKCHSAKPEKGVKGGLLLDTREGLLKGGDTGPAVVPGDLEKSLLIKAVRYADENLQMPPKNQKLSAEQIAVLEQWVKMGAPDPRTGIAAASGPPLTDPEKVRTHWAFQPVKEPPVPPVKNKKWVQSPIDNFVLAKLEEKKMSPSKLTDRRTLIRRASYDLTGLPPTLAEVEAFVADKSPEAFAKVVDRLLASPRYGERWGRHWLDVARYADTKGYLAGEELRRYPYSYTYRDYVIRAFNEDLPYDRFILEQLAADLLPLGEDKRPLAALGYLTLGRRFLNNVNDIIDDRIDVVTRGMMGLTVVCARCHDHKYDPVPTKDYYSLYGVFASSTEPGEKPLLGIQPEEKAHQAYLAEKKKRENELEEYRQTKLKEAMAALRKRVGDYILAADEVSPESAKASAGRRRGGDKFFQERKLDANVVRRWQDNLAARKKTHDPIFAPWFALADLPEQEFEAKAAELGARFSANGDAAHPLNPLVAKLFAGEPPKALKEVAERYGKLFIDCDSATPLEDKDKEPIRLVLHAKDAPTEVPAPENDSLVESVRPRLRQLKANIDEVDAVHPGAPPRAMSLQDASTPTEPVVFVRGNPGNRGSTVPRQFPEIAAGSHRQPFQQGSGRLEMAQAIVSRDNPLTARVMVNRLWMLHFGAGLVRTPSDFGVRSDPPTHPELLDWLAVKFVNNGWSIKKLHRLIMLTSTYQQASDDRADYVQSDPANLHLWKMNRQRLSFESLRDSLLLASGKLDLATGGQPVDIIAEPFTTRRTVYGFIERQNLPGLFRTFDFASPDSTSPQRFSTTVPQQSLFLLNSPFVIQQAQSAVNRHEFRTLPRDEDRVRFLYSSLYQRPPSSEELKTAKDFLGMKPLAGEVTGATSAGWQYGYGEFDAAAKLVKQFTPLPHFTGSAWQGGGQLPDGKLGWVMLNGTGGHPGDDPSHAAIRRWTAPRAGTVEIKAGLRHETDKGDGVRGRIISSRKGLVGEWTAHNQQVATIVGNIEVVEGETIDFLVDCRGTVEHDTFAWSPKLTLTGKDTKGRGKSMSTQTAAWNAEADFGQPAKESTRPLTAWEKFAQVLLLSNEFAFVD